MAGLRLRGGPARPDGGHADQPGRAAWTRTSVTPLFFAAVIVAAWGGGLGSSLFAAAGALVIQDVIRSDAGISYAERAIRAVLFLSAAAFVSSLVAARRRAESSEHERRVWYEGMLTGVGDCVIAADRSGPGLRSSTPRPRR